MENNTKKTRSYWLIFIISAVVFFLLGLLATSIVNRKAEKEYVYKPMVDIDQTESRNEIWGKNFPRQYESYMRTADTSFRSKYNGAALIDMLAVNPRMIVLWSGYAFSRDYTQGRGHYYSIQDIRETLRVGAPVEGTTSNQPNTCWTCKGPDVPRLMAQTSPAEFYSGTWETKGAEVVNSVGCADCHDAKTMDLTITRPALVEAFDRMGKDISQATHQEMRSLVCAQCHVEYYFSKDIVEGVSYVVFPWDNGFTCEDIEKYFDDINFTDWTHGVSKAPMLKAQHPEYETFQMGIHGQRGLACADCHMPYKSEGGQKFSDHHVQSPLNNVANSCQVCHREETATLIENVYERQDKIIENRNALETLLVRAHVEAKKAWDLGANENEMQPILQDIRKAQWRWDFVAASHGASFHAPIEMLRILGNGIAIAQEARIKLAKLFVSKGFDGEVPYPDISTKAKAQQFIGLDMDKLKADKEVSLKTTVAAWIQQAGK